MRVYCAGHMYDRARALAGNNPTYSAYIQEQYNAHLISQNVGSGSWQGESCEESFRLRVGSAYPDSAPISFTQPLPACLSQSSWLTPLRHLPIL